MSVVRAKRLKGGRILELPLSVLLGLVTLAALAPFMLLSAYTIYAWDRDARTAEINNLSTHADALMKAVDRELKGHIETAEAVSEARSLHGGDYELFWEHAEAVARHAGGHFILMDRFSQQLVNTRSKRGAPLPKTANPQAVLEVFRSAEVKVGNLGVGAVAQQILFSVRVPVEIDGEIKYVLSYVPRPQSIIDVAHETFRPKGWFAAVIDGNGRIVARSHRHDDFFGKPVAAGLLNSIKGRSGVISTVDLEGREVFASYQASRSNWMVVVWAARALLDEPASRALRLLLLLLTAALAASLLAAYLAGRSIHAPTQRLLEAAHGLAQGKMVGYRPSLMREANIVGGALDEAARTIKVREEALAEREAHTRFVLKELSHRSKNLLAVILAMASQSGRTASSLSGFLSRFRQRVAGLARSHDLLVKEDWSSVSIADLARIQLDPFVDASSDKVTVSGPRLMLKPEAAQNLGLAFHELATNSVKHGSLSSPSGRVRIEWEANRQDSGDERVQVRWRELSGPPCHDPQEKSGFGHVILSRIVPLSLHGNAKLLWEPDGFQWLLDAPAEFVVRRDP